MLSFGLIGRKNRIQTKANGAFDSFWAIEDAIPDNPYLSKKLVISDVGTDAIISVTSGTVEYSINRAAFTADPGIISDGDILQARMTSNAEYSVDETPATAIGVITIDTTDNTFTITNMLEPVALLGDTDWADVASVDWSELADLNW
jgi:hypothetical protein